MRALGYYDGYLGFLSEPRNTVAAEQIIDVGAGTAAFSEAWVAIHGAPVKLTLLDPSHGLLNRGQEALARRGVAADLVQGRQGDIELPLVDIVLAAHIIEHCPDLLIALKNMHGLLWPGRRLYLVASKPHWCNAIIWLQWRHRTFGKTEICDLLTAAGFEVEDVYAFRSGPPSRTSRGIVALKPV